MQRTTDVPILDAMPLGVAADFVEDVAALLMSGFQPARPFVVDHPDFEGFRDRAFAALEDDELWVVMTDVVREYLAKTRELSPKTPRAALGWFSTSLDRYVEHPGVQDLCRTVLSLAIGFPVHDLDITEYLHIDTVAADLGRSRDVVLGQLLQGNRLKDCYGAEGLFIPIDLVWELSKGHSSNEQRRKRPLKEVPLGVAE